MNGRVTVVVTGVGGGGLGHELLKALRLAHDTNYRLIACDMNPTAYGLHDADVAHLLPAAADPKYFETLTAVVRRERAQVIIPGSEQELEVLADKQSELRAAGALLLANAPSVIARCLDKSRTMETLSSLGISTPRWATASNLGLVTWPVSVVKPASGGGGSNLVFIAQSPSEVEFFVQYIAASGSTPIVQEYVGDARNEYTVGVLHSLDGRLVSSIAIRRDILTPLSNRTRLRARRDGSWLAVSSGISQGQVVDAPLVRKACERIAAALGSRGPLNIQLRLAKDEVVPFEINPRFSGTTCFRAMAGCNEPDLLIRHHLLGEQLASVSIRTGKALRALQERFLTDE